MKYHFIINPVAGKQDSSKTLVPEIRRAAVACGIAEENLEIQLTNRPSHAHYLAIEAAKKAKVQKKEKACQGILHQTIHSSHVPLCCNQELSAGLQGNTQP